MKIICVAAIALALAGCSSTVQQALVRTEYRVITPERSMFYCQNVRRFPNPNTLTDIQVAKLLVELHKNNTECQKNMNAIWESIDASKKQFGGKK